MNRITAPTSRRLSRALVVVAALSAAAAVAPPASGILGGTQDDATQSYIAAIDLRPAGFNLVASGVLISPTVLVTAGHVTNLFERSDLQRARVTFDPVVTASSTWQWGTVFTDPLYDSAKEQPLDDPNDLGVIVFDAPIAGITPAELPTEGLLDHLASDRKGLALQEVGYGVSARTGALNDPSLSAWSGDGTRKRINASLKGTHVGWLDTEQIDGATCRGDSGGPTMLGGIAVSVHKLNSNGNFCSGDGHGMRLDSADHRAFLSTFVTLP